MPEPRYRILLVEDDPIMGESLCDRFELEGYAPRWCVTADEALLALAGGERFSMIISDIRLPDMRGEQLFALLKDRFAPLPPVLFITGYGSVESAVSLLKQGAADYLTKPFDLDALLGKVASLCRDHGRRLVASESPRLGISSAMQRLESMLPRLAERAPTVLITGESGVGKEKVARALHEAGGQPKAPFVAVNCAALPENLLEAELFGHEKGAFTGATRSRRGVFEQAHGGTLFLDEIGDMPLGMQAKLLRVIQERIVTPLGSEKALKVSLRLICATHRDLRRMVESGDFREDLFYRINVVHLRIPPLRERREDIPWLAERELAARHGRGDTGECMRLSVEARQALLEHDWPGNVRELMHCLERASIFSAGLVLEVADLFPEAGIERDGDGGEPPILNDYLNAQERAFIVRALETHDWKITETAVALGISRKNLWEKMRRYDIAAP